MCSFSQQKFREKGSDPGYNYSFESQAGSWGPISFPLGRKNKTYICRIKLSKMS